MSRSRKLLCRVLAAACVLAVASATPAGATMPPDGSAPPGNNTSPDHSAAPTDALPPPDTSGAQTSPSGTNGIAIDDDGDLWIADGFGNQIVEVAADSGEIVSRWPTAPDTFPDDLVIDSDGTVFWTGMALGIVGRIDPAAGRNEVIATIPAGANPITFGADGTLLVGLTLMADALYRVDPSGTDDPVLLAEDLGNINAFDEAADGFLYAPRFESGEIVRIDPANGSVVGVVADGFTNPSAVREEADGSLVVLASTGNVALSRISLPGGAIEPIATIPIEVGDNFAIADDGTIYVTSFNTPIVIVVAPDGTTTELVVGDPEG